MHSCYRKKWLFKYQRPKPPLKVKNEPSSLYIISRDIHCNSDHVLNVMWVFGPVFAKSVSHTHTLGIEFGGKLAVNAVKTKQVLHVRSFNKLLNKNLQALFLGSPTHRGLCKTLIWMLPSHVRNWANSSTWNQYRAIWAPTGWQHPHWITKSQILSPMSPTPVSCPAGVNLNANCFTFLTVLSFKCSFFSCYWTFTS